MKNIFLIKNNFKQKYLKEIKIILEKFFFPYIWRHMHKIISVIRAGSCSLDC